LRFEFQIAAPVLLACTVTGSRYFTGSPSFHNVSDPPLSDVRNCACRARGGRVGLVSYSACIPRVIFIASRASFAWQQCQRNAHCRLRSDNMLTVLALKKTTFVHIYNTC